MGPSSELWDSAHLKGLFHFSPSSLSSGSAARARVSASSLIPSPNVSGLLGERIKLRMAKGPGQPLRATVTMCRPRDEGVPVDARVAGAGAGSYDHTCLHVSWARFAWGPRHRGCAHLRSGAPVAAGRWGWGRTVAALGQGTAEVAGQSPRRSLGKQVSAHPHSYSLMLTVRLAAFFSSWDTRACLALA